MTDAKTEQSIRAKAGLLRYGFGLVHKMTPKFLPFISLRSLCKSAQPLLILFFSARVLNELDGARDTRTIITYVSLAVGLTFVLSALNAILTREVELHTSIEHLYPELQLMQAGQFTKMDYAYAEDAGVSEILARMDVQARGSGIGLLDMYLFTVTISENLFSLVFSVLLLTALSAGGALSGLPVAALYFLFALSLLLSFLFSKREIKMIEVIDVTNAKVNTALNYYGNYIDSGQAAKDVRLYDQSGIIMKIVGESFDLKEWVPFFYFRGRTQGFTAGTLAVLSGGFYLVAGYGALGGAVPVGSIVQNVGAMLALAGAVGMLINVFGKLWNNAVFLKPMKEFMTLPDLLVKGERQVARPDGHDYGIEFRNVSFKYPGTDIFALQNLNLKLTPGERLAVVGLNGSGKTTMVKLLCRLYDPTEGEIMLDGVNIKEYNYEQYIALFSVVFQDFVVFPLWLGQNVAVSESYDAERANACLDGAGFRERLEKMPDGLDAVLYKTFDEDGAQISGGEAQKIALARALYKNAPVVVLDEPTAALDPIAEYEVYATFDETIGARTAVFISHRLSSCRFCQRVAVFDGGRLVQLGTHDGLVADAGGRYYELWEAQASHYREETEI